MSFLTGTNTELIYANDNPGTAKNTFTAEVSINDVAGMGPAPLLPAGLIQASRRGLRVVARGLVSSTGTPTFTFTLRAGSAAASTSGVILLGSAAITTATTITNKQWEFEGDVIFGDPAGSAATPGRGAGMISSPAGFASPFQYELWGGAAQPGTFSTFDPSVAEFLSLNATCSASSASNSVQLLQLLVLGLN